MASAVLGRGTKRNSLCNVGSCGVTQIIPVSCACCQRVLVKEEGVPRVLTGPTKKIKLEFDPEPFIKKETSDPSSPAPKPTQQEYKNETKRRGGEKIVFKEEDVDDGNKSEMGSTRSLASSDSSFQFAKPKANFGQYKQPFRNNYRGGSHYNQPPYYRYNNYRNNFNNNNYPGNDGHYRNNGHFGAFRGGFANAPPPVMQQILNQHLNGGFIPPRSPFAIKQPFSPFNAHIKTPPCSPLPPKPSFQSTPSISNVKSNVMSSIIPDPPRGPSPAASSQMGQGWWKSSEWPKKSSDSSTANPSNNGSVSSVPVSEIPPPSNADEPRTKTFIGKDHGLHTQRASCKGSGGTASRKSLSADLALDGDLCDGEDDQDFADNVVDDKDWIEELALEAVIPVKALCSSCLHSSEPEDGDSANADIEILFNSCDIQICSEEGSSISKESARRRSNFFNNTVEVVDINDFNDDVEDITPEVHTTITKRKLFIKKPNNDAFNTTNPTDNTDIVDLIEKEDECNEQIEEIGRSGENDPNLVRHGDHLLEVLDIGEDIVLDEVCGNGVEEECSGSPSRVNEPTEEEQEQTNEWDDQGAGNSTKEVGQPAAAEEGVEPAFAAEVGDINTGVGAELNVPVELSTGADALVDHSTKFSQPEDRAVEAAVVSNESWDEVLCEMQEVGDEVEELVALDVHTDSPSLQRPGEGAAQSELDRKVCDQESEVYGQGSRDQEIEVCDQEDEVTHMTEDKYENPSCGEEIQVVGYGATAVAVANEIVESSVVSTVSDDCEEVTVVEKELEKNSDVSSLTSCRKVICAKASGLGQPRTSRKLTRSTVTSTPVRLTRSLRPSSFLPDSKTCTDEATIVDDKTQLATPFSPLHQSTSSQSGVLLDNSVATSIRRSSRLTQNDPNVSLTAAAITSGDRNRTQRDKLKSGSTHGSLHVVVDIAPSAAIIAKLPAVTRAMLRQISHKLCKNLPITAEASCSTLDSEGEVGRVTRRSVAATPAAVAKRVDNSRRNNALAGRGATPAKEPSEVTHKGRGMTRRSVPVGSATLASLKNAQIAGSNHAVLSKQGLSNDGDDSGDGLGSEYELDYEEDLVTPEISNEEDNAEKSGRDVPVVVDDDDDVTCLD